MPFLPLNQQRQSTEGRGSKQLNVTYIWPTKHNEATLPAVDE